MCEICLSHSFNFSVWQIGCFTYGSDLTRLPHFLAISKFAFMLIYKYVAAKLTWENISRHYTWEYFTLVARSVSSQKGDFLKFSVVFLSKTFGKIYIILWLLLKSCLSVGIALTDFYFCELSSSSFLLIFCLVIINANKTYIWLRGN